MGSVLAVVTLTAIIAGVLVHGCQKKQPDEPEGLSGVSERTYIKKNKDKDIHSINRDYGCEIGCQEVYFFSLLSYDVEYCVDGYTYAGYKSLKKVKLKVSDKKYGTCCDSFVIFSDEYERNVIKLEKEIPCFDSSDREYDHHHSLYFFHTNKKVYALYCAEGYHIATLKLLEGITVGNSKLRSYMKSLGFPV